MLDTVFAPTTDALLDRVGARAGARSPTSGAGRARRRPGSSTRFPAPRVTGIDASEAFLAAARTRCRRRASSPADVTRPLPGAPYDLVYARFLLAHLPDVAAADRARGSTRSRPAASSCSRRPSTSRAPTPGSRGTRRSSYARVAAAGAHVYAGADITAAIPAGRRGRRRPRDRARPRPPATPRRCSGATSPTWGTDAVAQGLDHRAPTAPRCSTHLRDRVADPTRGLFTWTHHQILPVASGRRA